MKYINFPLIKAISILLLIVSLQACSLLKFQNYDTTDEIEAVPVTKVEVETPVVALVTDPYLNTQPNVSEEAMGFFKLANQAMANKKWLMATDKLLWLIENHPDLSGPYLNLAICYQQMGELKKAESMFQKSLEVNPNNSQAYNQYAVFLRGKGEFKEAERVYLDALSIWSDNPVTHLNLGILYDMYMGKLEKALVHYQRYQELLAEPDKQVTGWIIDTQRRLKTTGVVNSASA